ncbi:MAG: flippase-like domain-containing protein [Candidatus Stahlbacteria bacterium]|nr:flippase-like domain-containing protein [Candidatus Stahlbacteria bacterium]
MELNKGTFSQIKVGAKAFLIITVISITAILVITAKKETLSSLHQISPFFLSLALFTCLLRMYLECLRLQTLTWAFGNWLDFKSSTDFTIGGYFLTLTPFGAGGLPLQIYILMRKKFSFGESSAIIGMRGITGLVAFALLGIPALKIAQHTFIGGTGIKILSRYLLILYSIFFTLLILVMAKTDWVKYRLSRWNKFFIRRKKYRMADFLGNKVSNEIDRFKTGLKTSCRQGTYKLILTIFLSCLSLFIYTLIAPLIFIGLGIDVPIIETAIIQLVLTFVLMFAPTPGGSGIAEGIGVAIFRDICTKPELLGVYVVLWRFFSYYTGVILGGFIILRMLVIKKN